ncbi:MAG: corrinoid protein [Anaerolineales bacterium]|nr:MAG: corrinoid protein [Anaerolineales bacterium]
MSQVLFQQLANSLVDGDPDATFDLTKQALAQGIEPLAIINQGLVPGMNIVGDKFATGEYFLPDLIIAAEGMQRAMQLLEPELSRRQQELSIPGTVVIGTVKGDIHEIGKSLVATMLSANGFKVHDLGVNVPTDKFISAVQDSNADILGLSALLTTTMVEQQKIIQALKEAGLRSKVKIMVGGAPVTRSWAEEIEADGYAEDAMGAVRLAKFLVGGTV